MVWDQLVDFSFFRACSSKLGSRIQETIYGRSLYSVDGVVDLEEKAKVLESLE